MSGSNSDLQPTDFEKTGDMEIKPGTEITTGNVMPGYTMAQIVEYFPPTFDEPAGYTVIYPNASTGFITAATVERHNRV